MQQTQGEQALPGVCQAAVMELKFSAKPGVHPESPCWHRKQLSGESRSHLHFKVTQELELTGLQILLGTGSKDPAQGSTYGKTSEELILIHPFRKWDSWTLTSYPGGLRGPGPTAQGCCEFSGLLWKNLSLAGLH